MRKRISILMGILLLAVVLSCGIAHAVDSPYDGWWFTEGESGTGVSLEVQGKALFLAMYAFEETGQSTWLISGGAMASETSYSGNLSKFTGWPLGTAVFGAYPPERGDGAGDIYFCNSSPNILDDQLGLRRQNAHQVHGQHRSRQ